MSDCACCQQCMRPIKEQSTKQGFCRLCAETEMLMMGPERQFQEPYGPIVISDNEF